MAKTYFWLKIQEEFYRQKEIKILRQMENGAVYIIIYQKMLVYSLKNGNKLFYDHLKDSFEEEIALILDEEVEDVKVTVAFLKRAGLLDSVSDDEYVLNQVQELTGSESESTKRVKKHRENKKKAEEENTAKKIDDDERIEEDNVADNKCNKVKVDDEKANKEKDKVNNKKVSSKSSCNKKDVDCNKNVTLDIEKDIEKELEIETDKKIHLQGNKDSECVSFCVDDNLSNVTSLYEKNMGPIYPAGRDYFVDISKKFHWTLFKKAIEICIDKNNMTPAYLKGIIKKWDELSIYTLQDLQEREKEYTSKNKVKNYSMNNNSYEKVDQEMMREMEDLERKLGVS